MQIDFRTREVTLKLVYYGPALSGKTTNLKALHARARGRARPDGSGAHEATELLTLETRDDRTLFFDLLPLSVGGEDGAGVVRLKLFTVPGQVVHATTRKLVLTGADGVVFVADAQDGEAHHNTEAFLDLRDNLKEQGRSIRELPLVIQYNKMDLPNARPVEDLETLAAQGAEPVLLARALEGAGVAETFLSLLVVVLQRLAAEHDFGAVLGVPASEVAGRVARLVGFEGDLGDLRAHDLGRRSARP